MRGSSPSLPSASTEGPALRHSRSSSDAAPSTAAPLCLSTSPRPARFGLPCPCYLVRRLAGSLSESLPHRSPHFFSEHPARMSGKREVRLTKGTMIGYTCGGGIQKHHCIATLYPAAAPYRGPCAKHPDARTQHPPRKQLDPSETRQLACQPPPVRPASPPAFAFPESQSPSPLPPTVLIPPPCPRPASAPAWRTRASGAA